MNEGQRIPQDILYEILARTDPLTWKELDQTIPDLNWDSICRLAKEAYSSGTLPGIDSIWQQAVYSNNLFLVRLILKYFPLECDGNYNWALSACSTLGYIEMAKVLLSDQRVDPTHNHNSALIETIVNKHFDIFSLLIGDSTRPRVDPSADGNEAFYLVCNMGHTEMAKVLLADPRVDPTIEGEYVSFTSACEYGYTEIVKLLLQDPRIDPTLGEEGIIHASSNGCAEVVKLLLEDGRINPAVGDNLSIIRASEKGHVEVVRLLLADPRVIPCAEMNGPLLDAISGNHIEVVRLLLSHHMIDPSSPGDLPITEACRQGRTEIVRLLLADNRVNPSMCDNRPLKMARKGGHEAVVALLLDDPRVKE